MKYIQIIILLVLSACNMHKSKYYASQEIINIRCEVKETELPSKCKGISELIEQQWFYDTRNGYYIYDALFISILENKYQNCIKGLSLKQVIQILGKPNYEKIKNDKVHLCYFVNNLCQTNPYCNALGVTIHNDKVIEIGYGTCLKE